MKRTLLPAVMLLCLSSLFARPTLVLSTGEDTEGYALIAGVVERVAEHSLLSRMGGEGVLSITLSELLKDGPYALSATVHFSYGERELQLCLRSEAKDAKKLKKALEKKLSSLLLYDGRTFFDTEDALVLDYIHTHGYAVLSTLHTGDHYKGIDAQGDRWATMIVQRVSDGEAPVSLMAGTSGKKLLPGMRLEKQAGKSVSLSFSSLLSSSPSPSFDLEGLYSQEIGLYPFTLVLGGGGNFTASQLSALNAQAGFAVQLPLSMVFGLQSSFWRNSSVAMRCTLGLGYSFVASDPLYGSSAAFTYRYHLDGWGFDIGIGGKHWATETAPFSSGLFMELGLAYTW